MRYAHAAGLLSMSNYMLYNFHDTPADLYWRMRLNVDLNIELGLHIWSFPMRYQPTNLPNRSYVGEHWRRYQLRSMQIILQATHGIVSGAPEFFEHAFGKTVAEFERLLWMPHHYIFFRVWFESLGGKEEFTAYQREMKKLSQSESDELRALLHDAEPGELRTRLRQARAPRVRSLQQYYRALSKEEEAALRKQQQAYQQEQILGIPDDEVVEDAGLQDETVARPKNPSRRQAVAV